MSKTPFLLLFLIGWTPAYAVCDKCNTPFQCYERELCQFRDNAKADMATAISRLTTKHQAELAATSQALMDEYQTRLNAFEKAYTQKMAGEAELTQQARESAEKYAHQIRAMLEELSANRPWQEANSELKADIQRLAADNQAKQAEIQRLTETVNKQNQVDDQLSKQLTKVADQLSKRLTNVENRQTTTELSKRLTEAEEYQKFPTGKVFRDRLKDNTSGPEMVVIPAGTFRMGDLQGGEEGHEQPVHSVYINRFAMGRYEVTFAEYDKFASATGRTKPDSAWGRGNRPVINVSWDDATAYAQWLSEQTGHQYRLPTEAEWEYAARAGTETKYWWGNDIGSNNANCYSNYCGDTYQLMAPVGSFAANPFGLFDTAGNVLEWTCSEYQDKYAGKEQLCAEGGCCLALRGGSWLNQPKYVRSAIRGGYAPSNFRNGNFGFRLARLR